MSYLIFFIFELIFFLYLFKFCEYLKYMMIYEIRNLWNFDSSIFQMVKFDRFAIYRNWTVSKI